MPSKKTNSKKSTPKKDSAHKPGSASKRGKPKGKSDKRRGEYVYSKLRDLLKEEKDRVYLYAVVMDCSAPYYLDSAAKYLSTVKLIDDTLNPGTPGPEYLSATIFARTAEEIPQATKVGSVLRIHRGETKSHGGDFQLNCDVSIKAAWALFDPTEGVTPVAHTGRKYTFVAKDYQRLKEIREFSNTFFATNEIPAYVTLKDAEKKPEDFDTLCLVLEVKKKGDSERIRLCDHGKVVKLNIAFNRNPYISPQDVIRVRSANYGDKKTFKTLTLSDFSNLLRIPRDYKSARNLLEAIENRKVEDSVKSQLALYTPQVGPPLVLGEIKEIHKGKKIIPLKELFAGSTSGKGTHKVARVRVSMIEIGPKDPHGWLLVHNTKTHEQFKVEDIFTGGKTELPEDYAYYLKMQFFVKDQSVPNDTNLYIVFLCTIDGKGQEFIDLPFGRKKPTEDDYRTLRKTYKMLTRPWVALEMVLEGVKVAGGQLIYFVVDTVLKS